MCSLENSRGLDELPHKAKSTYLKRFLSYRAEAKPLILKLMPRDADADGAEDVDANVVVAALCTSYMRDIKQIGLDMTKPFFSGFQQSKIQTSLLSYKEVGKNIEILIEISLDVMLSDIKK